MRKRVQFVLQSFPIVQTNKLSKGIYGQFRDSMSYKESQPKAELMFMELITCNFLSRDLQTVGVFTVGILTLCDSWHAFA